MPTFFFLSQDRVSRALATTLTALGAGTAAALVWAQFRGYDMLDGAYYFLLYKDPADNPDTVTRFNLLARPLWLLCGQNIITFRFASIALASMACWFFWRAWRRLASPLENPGIYWWPLWLATMAGMTWVPVALTYNSLATIFGLLAFAIILSPSRPPGSTGAHLWHFCPLALMFAGTILAIYLAKPPAALAVAAGCYFLVCFDPRLMRWQRWSLVGGGILCLLAVAGAALFVITRPGFAADRYFKIAGAPFTVAMIKNLLLRYVREIGMILPAIRGDFAWTIVPVAASCGAGLFVGSASSRPRQWESASLALLLVAAFGALVARKLWDGSFSAAVSGNASRYYLLFWGSLLPIWILGLLRKPNGRSSATFRQAAWTIIFFALPLISSLGSTNTVYISALHQTVFWSAGLLLLADQIATAYSAQWFRAGVAVLLSIGAAGHIFSGHFLRPYMFQPSLWKQTESLEIGVPATRLKVDPALASFLRHVRATLDAHGYKPGDDVFGFFNLPGVIYAIGAKEPGAPWYFGTWYHDDEADGSKIRLVPLERRQQAWIVTQADLSRFRPQFLYFNIDFPDGYTKIGHTINPVTGLEVGIWKPRGRP